MFSTFENLNEEKKNRIINIAIEEFANKGYKNAVIDNIVAKAQISKGSIFQYFKNKKNLYQYICDYQYNMITQIMSEEKAKEEKDFFEIYRNAARIKFKIFRVSPYVLKFFTTMMNDDSEVAKEWLGEKFKNREKITMDFIGEYDKSKFKEDLDIEMAVQSFKFAIDGLSLKLVETLKSGNYDESINEAYKEIDDYINFYKKLYYKGEK